MKAPAPDTSEPAVYRLQPPDGREDRRAADPAVLRCEMVDLLRRNAVWFCRLRWAVAGLLAAAAAASCRPEWLAHWGLRLSAGWPLATAATLVVLNVAYIMLLPKSMARENMASVRVNLWAQIVVDLVVLTAVIHFVGSVETYALFVYLFHIILASIFFNRFQALAVAISAASLYLGCLTLEAAGGLSPRTVLARSAFPERGQIPPEVWLLQIGSALLIWAGIWYLASRQAGELRQRERDLVGANARLRAGIAERMRHMLQTTHQLKAPFAAIHAQAQLLGGGYCGPLSESAARVVHTIGVRCQGLSQQIHDMLQLANLRSEAQAPPPRQEIDLRAMVQSAIDRVAPAAAVREISLVADVGPVCVVVVEDYLRMLLDNLLTNAVNYSHNGSCVEVSLGRSPDRSTVLAVRDHGIGIPADKLSLVFDDYFRTKEAVRHNPSSTGLGLAIVRDVARLSGFQIDIRSSPGWGTEVTVTIPSDQCFDTMRPFPEGAYPCPTS